MSEQPPLHWFRVYHGRLWHLEACPGADTDAWSLGLVTRARCGAFLEPSAYEHSPKQDRRRCMACITATVERPSRYEEVRND